MRRLGFRGVVRGRRIAITLPGHLVKRSLDFVNRGYQRTLQDRSHRPPRTLACYRVGRGCNVCVGDWFANCRLMEPTGNLLSAELEAENYEQATGSAITA